MPARIRTQIILIIHSRNDPLQGQRTTRIDNLHTAEGMKFIKRNWQMWATAAAAPIWLVWVSVSSQSCNT